MIKSFFSKWFNRSSSTTSSNKLEVPKAFQGGKKSIFLNKYAGLIYFIITWHAFGYLIIYIWNQEVFFKAIRVKSIFLNKYAGLIYFIITWHIFGYLIVSFAKNTAKKEGLPFFLVFMKFNIMFVRP